MSLTLAAVADALIEFILSLLRDPDAAAEFEADPDGALAARGLHHVGPADVAAVAPIIIERTHVVHVTKPVYVERDHSPAYGERDHSAVVREIKQVTSQFQWVDDRDTIVDQSVNQNIWADGDVTQTFDNEAIVASGDDAVAAGADATVDKTWDESTTIEAGEDVNIGNDTDVQVVEDSQNEVTDASTTTDESTVVVVEDSFDEETEQADIDGSFTDDASSAQTAESVVDVVVNQALATQPVADASADQAETYDDAPEQPADPGLDSASQYVEADFEEPADDGLGEADVMITDEATDENF